MDLNGLLAALAATGAALNNAETHGAQLANANQQLLARVAELEKTAAAALSEPLTAPEHPGDPSVAADPPATP